MNSSLIVWLLSGGCFLLGCCQQFILGVPYLVADDIGVGLSEVGQLMTVFGLANGVGTPIALACLSAVEQRRQLVLGLSIMIAGMAVMAASSMYGLLMGVRMLMGIGHGVYVAHAYSIAQRVAPQGREAAYMANIALGFGLSQVAAIPLARLACEYMSWHVLYGVLTVLTVGAAVVIMRLVPPASQGEQPQHGGPKMLLGPLSDPAVRCAAICTLVLQLGYMGCYTYITPFMETALAGFPKEFVSGVLLLAGVMTMVGTKGSGLVADRIGAKKTLVGCMSCAFTTYALMLAFFGIPGAIIASVCLWIVFTWTYVPLQNLLLIKRCPQYASIVISLTTSFLQLGGAFGSAVGGFVVATMPIRWLPVLGLIGCSLGLFWELRSLKHMRQSVKE